ncbi:MAG: DNA polymerase III subunit beta [bacterium]|nr:DNA polymerase III subunit beta [Candidatus Sumerlaeota bacterium]
MRIKFKKADLLPAAAIAQDIINPACTLPILYNALIKSESESMVSLMATDYETRARIEVPAVVDEDVVTTVPAKTFHDLVKELPEDQDVVLEVREKGARILSKGIRCDLATLPARDFPAFPEINATLTFDVAQRDLKTLISKIIFSVPLRDPRRTLLGALFEARAGSLSAVATDGKIMAFARTTAQTELISEDINVIVPHKMLDLLMHSLGDKGVVSVIVDEKQIGFRFDNVFYITNLIEGKYPNYNAVVPKEFARRLKFPHAAMSAAIRRAITISDIKSLSVFLTFSGNQVVLEAENYEKGIIREELPAEVDGEDYKIAFNYKFLSEVMKSLDHEQILLQANSPGSPAVFRAADESDNFYLVMPIKLNELKPLESGQNDEAGQSNDEYDGAPADEE